MVIVSALFSASIALIGVSGPSYGIRPLDYLATPSESLHFGGTAARILGDHSTLMKVVVPDLGSPEDTAALPATHPDQPQIVLLEHDSHSPFYGGRDLHQSLPWGAHTFFGSQYLTAAIERDGVLATNLGGSISRAAGHQILMGCAFHGTRTTEPLVARQGNRLVLADSDVLADKLAGYNPAFIRELTGNNKYMRVVALAFSVAAMVFVMNLPAFGRVVAVLGAIALASLSHLPDVGDVRLCCETGSPHDESSAFAILRAINESGPPAIRGQKGCQILCVGSGHKARWAGEKVVILEPCAECRVGETIISCSNLPLGNLLEVPNAMQLRVGSTKHDGRVDVGGVVVIGTGSPSKQDVRKWLSTAP